MLLVLYFLSNLSMLYLLVTGDNSISLVLTVFIVHLCIAHHFIYKSTEYGYTKGYLAGHFQGNFTGQVEGFQQGLEAE